MLSCSITCFKNHKTMCKPPQPVESAETALTNEQKPLNLDEEEDVILSKEQLSVLKQNDKIMTMLRNKNLKKIIKDIDSAKYRKSKLEKTMKINPHFKEFTTEILTTLGFIKNNEFVYQK